MKSMSWLSRPEVHSEEPIDLSCNAETQDQLPLIGQDDAIQKKDGVVIELGDFESRYYK